MASVVSNGVPLSIEPSAEIALSRPAYRLGASVVGTVRLLANNLEVSPRSCFESAYLYVKGICKIDSRWHNADEYQMLYGFHPHVEEYERTEPKLRQDNTVCFWATNVIPLLGLEERRDGNWNDVRPKPIILAHKLRNKLEREEQAVDDNISGLERRQMAFTFRAELPKDLPHSASLNCCRYSYVVVVKAKTYSGENLVSMLPFKVLSPLNGHDKVESTGRVMLGSCSAMAHSNGLPCHVSIDEMKEPNGQVTVNRHTSLMAKYRDIQTLRVADPLGRPCCVLTDVGGGCMFPGGRLLIQLDFPIAGDSWLPCHQVSACLKGQEIAIYEDKSQRRTRSYVFDTYHETVAFGYTERISFSLLLPLHCPCSVQSDLVKVEISCGLDLTVDDTNGGFTNLQLELPIKVVHAPTADEIDRDHDDGPTLRELFHGSDEPLESNPLKSGSFVTKDIQKDLKTLSLLMADSCGLNNDYH